ncbi:MAG: EscU/YscU/HrcU family type III secretion system export apparatus switch protein, partial [Deltaproteobacteria bacterium]|nr:EscU/YscU/HrcU family type III secretion system export apparatus switch protein [Deltaproteobacteria bacterium]
AQVALPLGAVAAAAALAHVAQARTLWLPRRRVDGAPALDRGAGARVRRTGGELAAALAAGGVAVAWLWWCAPRLAALVEVPLAGGAMIASGLAALAIAWVAFGVVDALVRHAELAASLRMTARERREDERLAGGDPRWRRYRAKLGDAATSVAGATVLLLGDGVAVAIAWDPMRRPVPMRTATGRGARATQLLGLARRHRVPVHRDHALAGALVDGEGPVPEARWVALAEIVAAVGR